MKKMLLMTAFVASTMFGQTAYEIDSAHSSAQFSVRHLMVSNVRGEFGKLTGTFSYDPKNLSASSVEATIDANTINTREAKRDAHLKSPDFFDTAKYPTLSFKSGKVWNANGKIQLQGDLTMHGVTKEVIFTLEPPAEGKDPRGNVRIGAEATAKINRTDWGLKYNSVLASGGVLVGEEVTITLNIEATQKKPAAKTSN